MERRGSSHHGFWFDANDVPLCNPILLPFLQVGLSEPVVDEALAGLTKNPRRSLRVLDLECLMRLHQLHTSMVIQGGRLLGPAKVEPTLVPFDLLDKGENSFGVVVHKRDCHRASE